MSDFFKSSPMALRHCILFEILQENSIDQAYSNICSVIGKEVIDYKNFELQFAEGKFNDKEEENPIAEILRNDKYALRVCILYESLKYQSANLNGPIFEIFVNFCKVIGVEDVLKYPEFEFWFYRFLNREFDFNYEIETDKKIYEFSDIPKDVMENIVEYLGIFDRINLAKTSRSLQTFVEHQKLFHHILALVASPSKATISFGENSRKIEYVRYHTGCMKKFGERVTGIRRAPYWKQALMDLKIILKNPKLHLDTLKIEMGNEDVIEDLEDALKFTHHLNVKKLHLVERSGEQFSRVLPFLKPEYLTTINIILLNPEADSMSTVFEMEQWMKAKHFSMIGTCFIWPSRHLYHFEDFRVELERLPLDDIRQMKGILFKSPVFEKCALTLNRDVNTSNLEQEFGKALRKYPFIYHYPISNSTGYFEIVVRGLVEIAIKKKA